MDADLVSQAIMDDGARVEKGRRCATGRHVTNGKAEKGNARART